MLLQVLLQENIEFYLYSLHIIHLKFVYELMNNLKNNIIDSDLS